MATTISTQDLENARRDIDDIGKAVNEKVIVSPRYGEDFKSLPMIAADAQATIGEWQDAINTITVNDGVPALAVLDASGKTQQELNTVGVSSFDEVADLLSIDAWEGRTVYIHDSGFYAYKSGVWKNISVGYGGTVYLDDLVSSVDGSTNCSPQINAALTEYSGKGVTLIGNPSSTYKLEDTISFIGKFNIAIDFNGATILDNVQGFIGTSGGRANHTFVIYDTNLAKVKNFNYSVAPTRANAFPTNGIPTLVFWIGGQYLGGALTSNVEISGIKAVNQSILDGMFMSAVGEMDGITVSDVLIKGGDWRWGCNFEYGLMPEDWATNPTMTNGRHPYNIHIDRFRGENLPRCAGFLRTASCYNAKFTQCTGFNVPNFIYYYSGDRGISRFDQNVLFDQCVAKFDPNTYNLAQYTVNIVVTTQDGSTGEILPSWTNRDHLIKFSNCEFFGTRGQYSTAVRFTGSDGKVVFDGCTIADSYWGTWSQALPDGNPRFDAPYSLVYRDCVFKGNYQDVRQIDTAGVLYDNCKFKNRKLLTGVPYQIQISNLNGTSKGTTFRHCNLSGQVQAETAIRIESEGVYLDNNHFELFNSSTIAVSATQPVKGRANTTNGLLTSNAETAFRVIGDVTQNKIFTDISGNKSLNFNSCNIWFINSVRQIEQIIGGEIGDTVVVRGGVSGASATFVHNSPNATTTTRLINKSVANDTITGLAISRTYMKFSDGWREM